MFLKKLRKNKKGQYVLPLTLLLVIFNIFWYIIVISFTADGIIVGQTNNLNSIDGNITGDDIDLGDITSLGWIKRFFLNVWGLPWWLNVFIGTLNGIGLFLVGAAWFRGV